MPLASCVGAWAVCRWVPGPPRHHAGTGWMVLFAIHTYGRFVANYFARNLDYLLLGWRFGAQPLGFYKKGYDLFVLPASQLSNPLTSVAVSALSRLTSDTEKYKTQLLRALSTLAFVGMGIGGCLTLVGRDLIRLLLGPGWDESGRIFTFFGPGIGMMLLYGTHGWMHLSIGRADRWLRWGLFEIFVTALFLVLGLPWGGVGLAVAWAASFWILTFPALWYAGKPVGLGIASVVGAIWKYVLASALAGLAVEGIIRSIPTLALASGLRGAIGRTGMISLFFGVLYLIVVILLHRSYDPIRRAARLVQDMVSSGLRQTI